MKKQILLLIAVAIVSSLGVIAQTNSSTEYSRWSLAVKGGLDYFRVEPKVGEPGSSQFDAYVSNASWVAPVLQLEYTANPYFGFGLEAGLYNYNRYQLDGRTIDATLYGSANISNLVAPTRKGFWRSATLYGNFGLGAGYYTYNLNDAGDVSSFSPLATLSLSLEYNLGQSWALIGEGQYRLYTKNDMGGIVSSNYSTDAAVLNIGLRYKFKAKSKVHTRNVSVKDYYTDLYGGDAMAVAGQTAAKVSELEGRLNKLENSTNDRLTAVENDNAAIKDRLNKFENDLRNLNDKVSNISAVNASFDDIQFEFNSSKLTSSSYAVLDGIASVLKENASGNKITVSGHTDYIGSNEFNQRLSIQRANTVKDYLVSKGVPAANITVKGYGETRPIADNSTAAGRAQNRRVEFDVTK